MSLATKISVAVSLTALAIGLVVVTMAPTIMELAGLS